MLLLMFIILTSYAVRCDEASYYVIEMPENDTPVQYNVEKNFKIYWNVPTMQCKSKKIPFDNLFDKYGIIQNKEDRFRGEKISILYDPGLFPALLKNESSGKFVFRNGGVPQQGNLSEHISIFRDVLDQSIPDKDFDGIGIIDFESWRPVFRQNFGVLVPYKDVSYELVRKEYWWWPKTWIQAEAKDMFERAARQFMQSTLSEAKQLRPRASWGYYGFPYCFNMAAHNLRERCSDKVPEENDQTYWLWLESTALYPSIYSSQELTSSQLAGLVRGRVKESTRVRKYNAPILPYFWYRYRDGGFLTEKDLQVVLRTLYQSEASGFIIWGSSNDVNTANKCTKLHEYLDKVLGPAIAKYVKPTLKLKDDHINNVVNATVANINMTTTHNPILEADVNETKDDLDPEFHWNPPENYTEDIKKYVEEEFNRKSGHNISHSANKTDSIFNDTALVNILLHLLLDNNTEVIKEKDESSYNELDSTTEDLNVNVPQVDITESILEVNNSFKNDISTTEVTDVSTQNNPEFETSTELTTVSQEYSEIFNNNIFNDFTTEPESSTLESITKEGTTEENTSSTSDTTTSNNFNELPSTATNSFRNYFDEGTSTTESSTNYDVTSNLVSTTEFSTNNYTTTDVETSTDDKNTDVKELLDNTTETDDGTGFLEDLAESTLSLPSTATLDQVGGTTAVYKKPVGIYFIVLACLLTV